MSFNIPSKPTKIKYGAVINDTIKDEITRFLLVRFIALNIAKKLNITFTKNPVNTDIIKTTDNCGSAIDLVATLKITKKNVAISISPFNTEKYM